MLTWALWFALALAQEASSAAPELVAPALLSPIETQWPAEVDPALGHAAVDLELMVDETGLVTEATATSGEEPFVSLALSLVKSLRLSAATEGGVPVAVSVPLRLTWSAPPLSVEGVVHFAGSGAPAAEVRIRVGGAVWVTKEDGSFRVYGLPDGPTVVESTDASSWIAPKTIQIRTGEVVTLDLWARADQDLGIVGTYRRQADEVGRRSLDAETVRVVPGSLGDPLRAVQDLPGTVRSPLDTGWLLVRGGEARDTGIFIDGVRVPFIYHFGGFTSVINPAFIRSVEFVAGGQPARYGRLTAGMVDVVTHAPPEGWEARIGANLVFAGVFGAVQAGPVRTSVGVRRSYLDAVLRAVPGITEDQSSIAPQFWDWQARVDFPSGSLFGLGADDFLNTSDGDGGTVEARLATHRIHGAFSFPFADRSLDIRPSVAWERQALESAGVGLYDNRTTWSGGLRVETLDPGEGMFGWSAGVDAEVLDYAIDVQDALRSGIAATPEPWLEGRWGNIERRLVLGLRMDTAFVEGQEVRLSASPRLATRFLLVDGVAVRGDAGIYHQAPAWSALIGPPEGAVFPLEESWGGGVGVDVDRGPFHGELSAYGRRMTGLVGFEDDGSLGGDDGNAYGLEMMARLEKGRVLSWVSLGLSRSERREDPEDAWVPADYDQPVSLTSVLSVDLGRRWTLAGRWRYAAGVPAPEGGGEALDVLTSKPVSLVGDADGRLPAFHSLDLKLSKRFLLRRGSVDAYLDVQNVYNRRIAEPVIIGLNQIRFLDVYTVGLPVLPVFGVEVYLHGPGRDATK